MSPEVIWRLLLCCFLEGVLLGAAADVFRPLHRRFPRLSEGLISLLLVAAWLHSSFAICRGQLRMGFYLALLAGAGLWELLFGAAVGSFWGDFWHCAVTPFRIIRKFFHKIENFLFSR